MARVAFAVALQRHIGGREQLNGAGAAFVSGTERLRRDFGGWSPLWAGSDEGRLRDEVLGLIG